MGPCLTWLLLLELTGQVEPRITKELGGLLAVGIAVMSYFGWITLHDIVFCKREVHIDFHGDGIAFISGKHGKDSKDIPFFEIQDFTVHELKRRKRRSASHSKYNLRITYCLTVSLKEGESVRLFETPKERVAKYAYLLAIRNTSVATFGQSNSKSKQEPS